MGDKRRQLALGFSLVSNGTHGAGWRHPDSPPDITLDIAAWKELARTAERGKIHFIFFADGAAVRTEAKSEEALSYIGRIDMFEPLTLIAALTQATERIGFVSTASTTYNEPYALARKFASLDHLSGGRVGWNLVTTWSEAEALNFNRDKNPPHSQRYERAQEFIDVATGLWDSWEDDAFLRDKESGRYFDPKKMHVLNHKGEHFQVKGPLNIARPPQGYPVIAQAGASEPGQELAARTADIVYTAQQSKESAQKFYQSLKGRLGKHGRSEDDLKIIPGALLTIGRTDEEAREKQALLQNLIHPEVGLSLLLGMFGDLSGYPIDGPVPEIPTETNGLKSILQSWHDRLKREPMTIRQLYQAVASGSGHLSLVGSVKTIADQFEDWFTTKACDGFAIMVPFMPGGIDDAVNLLVPELQRRGLFHLDYEGHTLRESLGLPRPANRFAKAK